MSIQKVGFGMINEEDLIPKKHYSTKEIALAFQDEDGMTTWHFLNHKKILYSNGFANKDWIKEGLCFSIKQKNGRYKTFFSEKGYQKVLELWRNKPYPNWLS